MHDVKGSPSTCRIDSHTIYVFSVSTVTLKKNFLKYKDHI